PTSDVAAFELYSRAKDLILNTGFSAMASQNLRSGIDLLDQALARDASFFAAQCQLAYAHDTLYGLNEHTPERRALADAAVEGAFQLRPDAGESHLARANHLYAAYRDYDGALAELEVVRGKLPNAPQIFELTAAIARRRGAHEEGCEITSAPWNWIRATSSRSSNSPLATKLSAGFLRSLPLKTAHYPSNQMILRRRQGER